MKLAPLTFCTGWFLWESCLRVPNPNVCLLGKVYTNRGSEFEVSPFEVCTLWLVHLLYVYLPTDKFAPFELPTHKSHTFWCNMYTEALALCHGPCLQDFPYVVESLSLYTYTNAWRNLDKDKLLVLPKALQGPFKHEKTIQTCEDRQDLASRTAHKATNIKSK